MSYTNAIKQKRPFDVSDNIYGCLSGLSWRCFFKIKNFSDRFRQCFKFFYGFEKQLLINFLEFSIKILKKNSVMKSRFINVAQRRIQNSVKQLQWSFLRKQLTGESHKIFSQKIRILLDVWLSYKYASVAGLNSYKDIFQQCFDANPYYLSPVHLFVIFLILLLGRGCFIEETSATLNLA